MNRSIYALSRLGAVAMGVVTIGILSTAAAQAATRVVVQLTTGSDDLRGGNNAFISLVLADGTSTSEKGLGGGFGQNSVIRRSVVFPETVSLSQIRSITIRHDGAPRSGHPFDTYDNWDLQRLSVSVNRIFAPVANIYNSVNDPARRHFVQRFTGDTRQLVVDRQLR